MNNGEYLIGLLANVVAGKPLPEPDDNIDLLKVYEIAEKHSVQTTAYYGIKKLQCAISSEALSKWEEAHLRGLSVSIRFKAELNNVCDVFTKEKLVHMPLKGSIIKNMYPSTDMRSMSDMDILIKREDAKKVHDILIGMGYTCDMYDISHQDVYFKDPIYNIEIHTSLFDDGDGVTFYREYDNILDRTVTVDNEYARLMTDEDFYVYNVAHFAKHFQLGGSGIRSVMDMYIMKKSLTGMDMAYVNFQSLDLLSSILRHRSWLTTGSEMENLPLMLRIWRIIFFQVELMAICIMHIRISLRKRADSECSCTTHFHRLIRCCIHFHF